MLTNTPDPRYGSYDELLADPGVDAVYVPLPTGVRKEWVIKAAAAGKHVLVEKPVGCTMADASEMVAACSAGGVLLMDGVMFMHHDRLATVRGLLDSGAIGETAPSKMVRQDCTCLPLLRSRRTLL